MTFEYQKTPRPTHSPWGAIQEASQIFSGVWMVSTASHGGFHVSAERLAASGFLREFAPHSFKGQGKGGWFEEDCDWCFVPLAFPDEWKAWRGERGEFDLIDAQRTFTHWIKPKVEKAEAA